METQLARDTAKEKSGRTVVGKHEHHPSPFFSQFLQHRTDLADEDTCLELIESGEDLTVQCTKCFDNLDRCIKAAEIAGQVDYFFTRTVLAPIRNVIHERRLRLSIWMSDCGVHGGNLSLLDSADTKDLPLLESLRSLFMRIDSTAQSLFKATQSIKSLAEQAVESTDDRYAYFSRCVNSSRC